MVDNAGDAVTMISLRSGDGGRTDVASHLAATNQQSAMAGDVRAINSSSMAIGAGNMVQINGVPADMRTILEHSRPLTHAGQYLPALYQGHPIQLYQNQLHAWHNQQLHQQNALMHLPKPPMVAPLLGEVTETTGSRGSYIPTGSWGAVGSRWPQTGHNR